MSFWMLIRRDLLFYRRAHAGTLIGAALATAILTGALVVGDSVRFTLDRMALTRLGEIHYVLNAGSRLIRSDLAGRIAGDSRVPAASALLLKGMATAGDVRASKIQVVGVDEAFWRMNGIAPILRGNPEALALSDRLARKLGVKINDDVVLRIERPSQLSRDSLLSVLGDSTLAFRLPVAAIVGDREMGRFGLDANQTPPLNAFVPLRRLQEEMGTPGRANAILVGNREKDSVSLKDLSLSLWRRWRLADAGFEIRDLPGRDRYELRTDRIFLDASVAKAALKASPNAEGALTYFVNEIRLGDRSTPYSTVAALDGPLTKGMESDEILINRWLADDLGAAPGDRLNLTYYVIGSKRTLETRTSAFRVRRILQMDDTAIDPSLMPEFPGLTGRKSCRDWESGLPIDLGKIRAKDERYWEAYQGAPKAFLSLRAGQRIWSNRFGIFTAARYPKHRQTAVALDLCIRQAVNPASLGLFFQPIRERALAASSRSTDFGTLFLGFSVFLIFSAMTLTALLFAFGAESRKEETGILLAIGFTPKRVRGLMMVEGGAIALAGAILGAGAGSLYAKVALLGLRGAWSGAVTGASIDFHARPVTLAIGAGVGFLAALAAIALVSRRLIHATVRESLAFGDAYGIAIQVKGRSEPGAITAVVSIIGALLLVALSRYGGEEDSAGYFFGAGFLLLLGGWAGCRAGLRSMSRSVESAKLTLVSLALRNSIRRPGRSLAIAALLSSGVFLVIAVGASQPDPDQHPERRSSGTGGFAFYAETTLPVYQEMNGKEGRETFGLTSDELRGARFVSMRLKDGDEASCLNLNRAQSPKILGVDPGALVRLGAFSFIRETEPRGWRILEDAEPDDAIPVVGDTNTVVWSLGLSLGDILPYTDDRGHRIRLRIAGILENSILQGGLLMSEREFLDRFPGESGYRVFLIDAKDPPGTLRSLSSAMTDVGFDATPATERLTDFSGAERAYLSIFAALGGLGLLLGSAGLGIVALRNAGERRSELGLLRAEGFANRDIRRLLFLEHTLPLTTGSLIGVVASSLAVWPSLRTPGAEIPSASLVLTVFAILLNGMAWIGIAAALALHAPLLSALRDE